MISDRDINNRLGELASVLALGAVVGLVVSSVRLGPPPAAQWIMVVLISGFAIPSIAFIADFHALFTRRHLDQQTRLLRLRAAAERLDTACRHAPARLADRISEVSPPNELLQRCLRGWIYNRRDQDLGLLVTGWVRSLQTIEVVNDWEEEILRELQRRLLELARIVS